MLASSCSHAEPVRLHACASDRHLGKALPLPDALALWKGWKLEPLLLSPAVQQLACGGGCWCCQEHHEGSGHCHCRCWRACAGQ